MLLECLRLYRHCNWINAVDVIQRDLCLLVLVFWAYLFARLRVWRQQRHSPKLTVNLLILPKGVVYNCAADRQYNKAADASVEELLKKLRIARGQANFTLFSAQTTSTCIAYGWKLW